MMKDYFNKTIIVVITFLIIIIYPLFSVLVDDNSQQLAFADQTTIINDQLSNNGSSSNSTTPLHQVMRLNSTNNPAITSSSHIDSSPVVAVFVITKDNQGNLIFLPNSATIKPGEEILVLNNDFWQIIQYWPHST